MTYLIESLKHQTLGRGIARVWWGPAQTGYVYVLGKAGLYSEREASDIVTRSNITGTINSRMVPYLTAVNKAVHIVPPEPLAPGDIG